MAIPEPAVIHSWTYIYARPPRMGWPVLAWRDSWRPDRPLRIAPKQIRVRVYAGLNGQPVATVCDARGDWQAAKPAPGTVRRMNSDWIGLHLEGQNRYANCRMDAPDWVREIAADAVARARAELGVEVSG
jgi:hypothetical protein